MKAAGGASEANAFVALQRRLRPFERNDPADAGRPITILAIPSINMDQDVLDLHADELPALEERCLYLALALRAPRVRVVAVTSLPVRRDVADYYLNLLPAPEDARGRLQLVSPGDASARPLAQKMLERPDLLARLRELAPRAEDAFIVPFNVRGWERELALALDVPIYGIDDRFAVFGTKTGGRRLFARAGVSHPRGENALSGVAELGDALMGLHDACVGVQAAVIKLDEGVSGEGNRVLSFSDVPSPGTSEAEAAIDARLRDLPVPYLEKLSQGGVVEEMISGETRSPSVQVRILPGGRPVVLSTHDQVLGGELGQTFLACRFPADSAYSAAIVAEARKVAEHLAQAGAVGRFAVDFVVARRADAWQPYAVEINLREGGTSHPYGTLSLLTGGSFEEASGMFRTAAGQPKHYVATDRLAVPHGTAASLDDFRAASSAAALDWNPGTQTGAVYHMLRALEEHGNLGVVAIGNSSEHAEEIYVRVEETLHRTARAAHRRKRSRRDQSSRRPVSSRRALAVALDGPRTHRPQATSRTSSPAPPPTSSPAPPSSPRIRAT